MWFISDSEGALGLLGTVWGMYTTFMGGIMQPQYIIGGMGVALVTTLYGLIASLIINLFTTEIIAMNPPKLVQAILKNIQNNVDNDTCGAGPSVLSGFTMRVTSCEHRASGVHKLTLELV